MNPLHKVENYKDDFSNLFTERSLIDKAYADKRDIISANAGQDISSGRVVYIDGSGNAFYFDIMDETLAGKTVGFTLNASLQNDVVNIQTHGIFKLPGLGLSANQNYYIGANGILTTSVSGLKIVQQVGVSIDADTLAIHIYSPIITI